MQRIAWLLLLFVALLPTTADARSPASKWVSADLPMIPSWFHHHDMVPLEAPSTEHPLGTVAIIGSDVSPTEDDESEKVVWAYAWDLAAKRVLAKKPIGRTETSRPNLVAVRAGGQIMVATGPYSIDARGPVHLFTLDVALDVVSREVVGLGAAPSLAVSDAWIVVGFFEHRSTDVRSASPNDPPLAQAFHAVVLDRSTHVVVGARVFQGHRLLMPDQYPRLSMRAIAIHDGRAYVSLPGWAEAILVSTKLPSLVPMKTRTLAGFQLPSGSAPIYPVGRSLVVVTPQGWRVLSPELEIVERLQMIGYAMAWNPRRATLFETSSFSNGFPWNVAHLEDNCYHLVWVGDRPVAMCDGNVDPYEPMRIVYLR